MTSLRSTHLERVLRVLQEVHSDIVVGGGRLSRSEGRQTEDLDCLALHAGFAHQHVPLHLLGHDVAPVLVDLRVHGCVDRLLPESGCTLQIQKIP